MKFLSNLFLAFILLSSFTSLKAQEINFFPDQVMVMVHQNSDANELIDAINETYPGAKARIKKTLSPRLNIQLIEFDPAVLHYDKALSFAITYPSVQVAQFNHTDVVLRATVPNDTEYPNMWQYDNDGTGNAVADADIDAPEAWDISTGGLTHDGDTIVVAVIDGGFDLTHEDLNYWVNHAEIPNNNIDDDNNGFVDDYEGWNAYNSNGNLTLDDHGTHVAGTIGAKGNNTLGIVGVNWGLQVMAISGSSGQESTVVEAYSYAHEMRARYNESNGAEGAFVVATNSSFGVNFGNPDSYPLWCNFYDSLGAVGILSAGATINNNTDVDVDLDIPTACESDYMISVTNMRSNDNKNNGAGYGATTIDLGAPGTGILSTVPGNDYEDKTGTSMATPHVAGAIALMYSVVCNTFFDDFAGDPGGQALWIRDKLLNEGVDQLNSLSGLCVSEGRLNIHKALQAVQSYCVQVNSTASVATCNNCDGDATATAFGGQPPYTYLWDDANGQTTATATGLCAGSYSCTVSDGAGNETVGQVAVNSSGGPTLLINLSDASCHNSADGEANANVIAGTPPYTYSWDNGGTASFNGTLVPGVHFVTVTDNSGCPTVEMMEIQGPPPLTVTAVVANESSVGNDGGIDVQVSGFHGPYQYLWNTGFNGEDLIGITGGTYTVNVVDQHGCTESLDIVVGSAVGARTQIPISVLSIYPNPSSNGFWLAGIETLSKVDVYDATGRLVKQVSLGTEESLMFLDLNSSNSGVFLLRWTGNDGQTGWERLVKM